MMDQKQKFSVKQSTREKIFFDLVLSPDLLYLQVNISCCLPQGSVRADPINYREMGFSDVNRHAMNLHVLHDPRMELTWRASLWL